MAEDGDRRRFSGGIATDAPVGAVIDAEFVTLDGPATASRPLPPMREKAPVAGMDILRGGEAIGPRRGGPLFWACGTLVIASAFWISGGHALLASRAGPQPAGALAMEDLSVRIDDRNGRSFVMVDGRIANGGPATLPVPAVAIDVVGTDGRTVRHLMSPRGEFVAPGTDFAFSSRLDAPMEKVDRVSVELAE